MLISVSINLMNILMINQLILDEKGVVFKFKSLS